MVENKKIEIRNRILLPYRNILGNSEDGGIRTRESSYLG